MSLSKETWDFLMADGCRQPTWYCRTGGDMYKILSQSIGMEQTQNEGCVHEMRISRARRPQRPGYYSRYLTHSLRENATGLLFGGLLLGGVLLGVLLIGKLGEGTVQSLTTMLNGAVEQKVDQSYRQIFLGTFASNAGILLLLFFSGFCAIGQPIQWLVCPLKGLGYGLSAAYLLTRYGTDALLYVILVLLPGGLLSSLLVLKGASSAFQLTKWVLSRLLTNGREEEHRETGILTLKRYILRFVTLTIAAALLAALDGGIVVLLASKLAPAV